MHANKKKEVLTLLPIYAPVLPCVSCSLRRSAIQPMIPIISPGFCLRWRRISLRRPQIRCSALSRIEQVLISTISASSSSLPHNIYLNTTLYFKICGFKFVK